MAGGANQKGRELTAKEAEGGFTQCTEKDDPVIRPSGQKGDWRKTGRDPEWGGKGPTWMEECEEAREFWIAQDGEQRVRRLWDRRIPVPHSGYRDSSEAYWVW